MKQKGRDMVCYGSWGIEMLGSNNKGHPGRRCAGNRPGIKVYNVYTRTALTQSSRSCKLNMPTVMLTLDAPSASS